MDIKSMSLAQINDLLEQIGEKQFRAKQIFEWLHKKNVTTFDDMTNLSKQLRYKLSQTTSIDNIEIVKKLESSLDGTTKYLFALKDDNIIESVLMKYDYGNTVCISSQIGCRMGCKFCASTIDGMVRNLTVGEMLNQVYTIQKDSNQRISNIVIMGSGEPFDNYNNLIEFINIINSPLGLNIGQRHITVSTSGLVDKIYDFTDENLQVTLAISLHAPDDEIRKSIMPIAKKYSLDKLIEACKYYTNKTSRRITFEYALIENLNDNIENARQLGKMIRHMLCHVNLIPVNEIKENQLKKSSQNKVNDFAKILNEYGVETTIRRKLGNDIDAACGQLRRKYLTKSER